MSFCIPSRWEVKTGLTKEKKRTQRVKRKGLKVGKRLGGGGARVRESKLSKEGYGSRAKNQKYRRRQKTASITVERRKKSRVMSLCNRKRRVTRREGNHDWAVNRCQNRCIDKAVIGRKGRY